MQSCTYRNKRCRFLMSDNYEEMIVNHYMKIHILTKAFGEQIEATQNLKCISCENYIFSDNPTFTFCIPCADEMEDLAYRTEEE